MRGIAEQDPFVNLVADDVEIVLQRGRDHSPELLRGIDGAGRIARRVEHQNTAARRDRRLQDLRSEFESGRLVRGNDARRSSQHPDLGRIGHPVGRRHQDIVSGIDQHRQRHVDRLLRPRRDQDLVRLVVESVFPR